MRLSEELVGQVEPFVGTADEPGIAMLTDEEYPAIVEELLSGAPDGDFWIFAFGSLIWNPACAVVEQRVAVASGWHRSFCLGWDEFFRGSRGRPGLMLSLDRGGQCQGVAYRLPREDIAGELLKLARRELRVRSRAHVPRWISVRTQQGPLKAMAFVINRQGGRYVPGLSIEEVADALALAAGPRGSMAEYLYSTVRHLEELGVRDRHLWRLQEMVGERIEAAAAARRAR